MQHLADSTQVKALMVVQADFLDKQRGYNLEEGGQFKCISG